MDVKPPPPEMGRTSPARFLPAALSLALGGALLVRSFFFIAAHLLPDRGVGGGDWAAGAEAAATGGLAGGPSPVWLHAAASRWLAPDPPLSPGSRRRGRRGALPPSSVRLPKNCAEVLAIDLAAEDAAVAAAASEAIAAAASTPHARGATGLQSPLGVPHPFPYVPALGRSLPGWSPTVMRSASPAAAAAALARRRAERYKCRCRQAETYTDAAQPALTAIVQSFNHVGNVPKISAALVGSAAIDEIVVCEDGSSDGSLAAWRAALTRPNDFIIRSNNLHELRSYNRAMRMASGDVVVLMQDDDLPPPDGKWLETALALFRDKPDLGLLGGYIGQTWDPDTGKGAEYGEQFSTHGGVRKGNTQRLAYTDPSTGVPFMYVECAWIAPVFIRRDLLRKAGGLELAIAKRGEPGVWQDCVASYETWVNGYTVGIYDAPFARGVGGHGSATSPAKLKLRERVWQRAVAYTNRKYPRRKVHDYVVALNERTLTKRDAGPLTE